MNNHIIKERPFEYLRDKTGNRYPEEVVRSWYIARVYVLSKLKDIIFLPGQSAHLHVIIDGDSPLMLSVVRFVAFYAHYLNFEEEDLFGNIVAKNRTVISLLSRNESIDEELRKEEFLCNLMAICRWSKFGGPVHNADSYLDIELRIEEEASCEKDTLLVTLCEKDVHSFINSMQSSDVFCIDTRKAVLVGRIYELGAVIDNLPAEDIHCAKRYTAALSTFENELLHKKMIPLVDDCTWSSNQRMVKNGISSILCSDCFEARALAMNCSDKRRSKSWGEYNKELSMSEHARWVTERLILGYRPFNDEESFQYESLFGSNRDIFNKHLKNSIEDPTHVDICSFRNLRRINPSDLKYDSFLLLAVPSILAFIQ